MYLEYNLVYLLIASGRGPWKFRMGFLLPAIAKLDLGMYLMQCSSFLNYSNHLDSLEPATVSLRSHKMMLNPVGSYIIIDLH